MFKVPGVPDRTAGIEDYQGTTKALQPVKLPEAGTDGMCRSKAPSRCSLMDDDNDNDDDDVKDDDDDDDTVLMMMMITMC